MIMKTKQKFYPVKVANSFTLDLLLYTILTIIVFCLVDLIFIGLFPEIFAWTNNKLLQLIITACLFSLIIKSLQIVCLYPQKKNLSVLNFYNIQIYQKISIEDISLVMVYPKKKWRYNIIIITEKGARVCMSIAKYHEFIYTLKKNNTQIMIKQFDS